MRLPQGVGVKRMHVLSYLISCGFQRCVPRIIGRAIRGTLSNGARILDVFCVKLELDMKITHAVHTQILCGFQSHYPPNSKSPSGKIGPRCSPKARIKHSGNAQAVIRGMPGRGREENARSIVSHLMRLPKRCSPNHRTSDSGNALQWREDNRCVSCKAGA